MTVKTEYSPSEWSRVPPSLFYRRIMIFTIILIAISVLITLFQLIRLGNTPQAILDIVEHSQITRPFMVSAGFMLWALYRIFG